ncbi:MAG: CPXCG motif-containing cysteine-rich protein [Gammaproteobacteria bacterium]
MQDQIESFFSCPYCGERISILIDPSADHQSYIEDCEVCCRPIAIAIGSADDELPLCASRSDD